MLEVGFAFIPKKSPKSGISAKHNVRSVSCG
jgi:hypothetical protein